MTVVDMNHDNWKTDRPIFVPKTGAIEKNALFTKPAAKHPSIPRGTFWKSALKEYLSVCGNLGWADGVADTGITLKEKRRAAIKNKFWPLSPPKLSNCCPIPIPIYVKVI